MNRILIVRLSAIGDVIMASGIVPAIRAKYPDAHLTWLVEPMAAGLLRENSLIDDVVVWPKNDWKALWKARKFGQLLREIKAFRRQLLAQNFDIAVDLQGILKSAVLARLSGAPRRVGLEGREGGRFFLTEVVPKRHDDPVISSEYRDMTRYLGLDDEHDFAMHIPYADATEAAALDKLPFDSNSAFCVLCPFTTRPQKHWFDDYWVDLVQRIRTSLGVQVLILGGPGDVEHAEKIVSSVDDTGVSSVAGKTSLLEVSALIARAKLLVGVDTGLTHLGIAQKIPTVALFGSTRPYIETKFEKARVMYLPRDCSPCRRNPTCDGRFDCMREILPENVMALAEQLMP